ncbi:hypothetical protein D3C85_1671410 [compost metagenome]
MEVVSEGLVGQRQHRPALCQAVAALGTAEERRQDDDGARREQRCQVPEQRLGAVFQRQGEGARRLRVQPGLALLDFVQQLAVAVLPVTAQQRRLCPPVAGMQV